MHNMAAGVFRWAYIGMGICGIYQGNTRVRFPIPGIPVLGVHHPVDGYGVAAGPHEGRDVAARAPRATRARAPEVAPLGAPTKKYKKPHRSPCELRRQVRAVVGPTRRAMAQMTQFPQHHHPGYISYLGYRVSSRILLSLPSLT